MIAGPTAAMTQTLILGALSGQIGTASGGTNMRVKAPFRARAGSAAAMEQA
jgi:hypothetical protein